MTRYKDAIIECHLTSNNCSNLRKTECLVSQASLRKRKNNTNLTENMNIREEESKLIKAKLHCLFGLALLSQNPSIAHKFFELASTKLKEQAIFNHSRKLDQ